MKIISRLFIYIFNFIIICFIVGLFYNYKISEGFIISNNYNNSKLLNSSVLYYDDNEKIDKDEFDKTDTKEEKKELSDFSDKGIEKAETNSKELKEEIVEEKKPVVKDTNEVIDFYTGSLAAYGIDCYGCSGKSTSSGFYLTEGNIYYSDKTYGSLRVLAGDKSYPYGTVIKIIFNDTPIMGVVLDRGASIGFNKKFNFDILFKTNKEALNFGSKKNVTFEILRLGY